jgi:hypothetical protein
MENGSVVWAKVGRNYVELYQVFADRRSTLVVRQSTKSRKEADELVRRLRKLLIFT